MPARQVPRADNVRQRVWRADHHAHSREGAHMGKGCCAVQCNLILVVSLDCIAFFACCLPLHSGMHLFYSVLQLTGSIELCNKAATA